MSRTISRLRYRTEDIKEIWGKKGETKKRRRRGTRGCANRCAVHRVRVLAFVYTFARLRSGKRKGTAERAIAVSTAAPATRLSKARERVERIGIESKEKRKIKKEQGANEREREREIELLCVYFIGV